MWKDKLAALIETRKIIALSLTTLLMVMALRSMLPVEYITPIITMGIGYYFGGSTARDNPKKM